MKRAFAFLLAMISLLSLVSCTRKIDIKPEDIYEGSAASTDETATKSGLTYEDISPFTVSLARYPEMAKYPNEMSYIDEETGTLDSEGFFEVYDAWYNDKRAQLDQPFGYKDGMDGFVDTSIRQFLTKSNGKNLVYSPLNIYMALAMLAEVTDGNSREQILELLGSESIELLRTQARSVWNANYMDDGAVTSVLANSLWLNDDVKCIKKTMDNLTDYYYASSFSGKMGSDELNKALQSWINEQTGGLLEEQASDIEMRPDTILALASTIHFRAKWGSEFSKNNTEKGIFNLLDGNNATLECDFMHKNGTQTYYWAENFAAVGLRLEGSGNMWFLLPDEGVDLDELLNDEQTMNFLHKGDAWDKNKFLVVNMSIPKFDVASTIELSYGLQELGVTDIFDNAQSDFSPMTADVDEIYLSRSEHAARVAIDEEGVIAAAYTMMAVCGEAMPPDDKVDFVLDRPFLFAITGTNGQILFVGVVNQPG
jgi:serine protease inhibitor